MQPSQPNAYFQAHPRTEGIHAPSAQIVTSLALPPARDTDDESVLSAAPSSPEPLVQSVAEQAREKKLRDDPMAIVLGPLHIDCRRCGKRIKLSSKSHYDPFHWRTHRERCMRREPESGVQKKRTKARRAKLASIAGTRHSPIAALQSPTSPNISPPLTPDDDNDTSLHDLIIKERSPTPPPSRLTFMPPVRQSDIVFEEYLLRSHRSQPQEGSPRPSESWQDWRWSQLISPDFSVQEQVEPKSPVKSASPTEEPSPEVLAAVSLALLSRSA